MANNRKEYLERTISTIPNLHGDISRILVNDDSGDPDFQQWLLDQGFEVNQSNRSGFTGAMISSRNVLKDDPNEWIFHLEEDFLILEKINLLDIIEVMEQNPHIVQVVLQRQGIGQRERKMGGVMKSHPERYEEKTDGKNFWCEHRVNYSTNPSLYRKSFVVENQWPDVKNSERHFSKTIFKNPLLRCAYWGKRDDSPKVYHIGDVRNGFYY